MTERINRIAAANLEAERLLKILNESIDKHLPVKFDPCYLYDLVVYDEEGETVARFPLEHTTYTIHEDKLLVESYGSLRCFSLHRYSYYTEGR